MSYDKNTWAKGDVITASKLNNIESGIEEVNMSYDKTTWAKGDVITATKLNKIEDGIANAGGGGGGDITEANVTIKAVANYADPSGEHTEVIADGLAYIHDGAIITSEISITVGNSPTYDALLYQGSYIFAIYSDFRELTFEVSGNATYEAQGPDGAEVTITGDCEITIKVGELLD